MEKLKIISFSFFGLILLISLPTVWALLVPGFFGASDDVHIGWLYEMDKVIKLGQIPPRFVPDLSYGFGYPLFNFVYPLPFYIAEVFHLSGFNLVDSIKALFFISMPISALFMYLLLRQFTGRVLSITGAVIYLYAPYRANDLYNRGAIGEIVSFIFLPLILLAIIKLFKGQQELSGNLKWIGIGGLSLACLILTHNITAFMYLPFLLLFMFLRWHLLATGKLGILLNGAAMFFLAVLNSLYFWMPAILDSQLMKYDTVFNFVDHFPTVRQLITPFWGYGASVPGPYDGMSFFLGFGSIAVMILGSFGFYLGRKKITVEQKILIVWSLISLGLIGFLMNYRSSLVWENAPLLPYFQFPWRFLILTTFFAPLFVVGLEHLKFKTAIGIFLITLSVGAGWSYFEPNDFLQRKDEYYLNRYIPYPNASDEYRQTQEEYLRLPKETKVRPEEIHQRVFPSLPQVQSINQVNELTAVIETDSHFTFELNYNKYYFPGWKGFLDGKPLTLKPGDPFGQITFEVPSGKHSIMITFKENWFKRSLDFISAVSLLVSIGLIFNVQLLSVVKYYRKKMSTY